MLFLKKGWIENRRTGREKTTLLVDYRVIQPAMVPQAQKDPNYSKNHVKGALAASCAQMFGTTVTALEEQGLNFCSQEPLQDGWWIEMTYKVPKWDVKVRFLARLSGVRPENEMREVVFASSAHLHSAHGADLQTLTNAILGSKR
jgi:hypothetical protein